MTLTLTNPDVTMNLTLILMTLTLAHPDARKYQALVRQNEPRRRGLGSEAQKLMNKKRKKIKKSKARVRRELV